MGTRHADDASALEPEGAGSPQDTAGRVSVLLALRGLVAVAFGLLALAWPGITVLALAVAFAAYVVIDAAGMLATGMRARGPSRWLHVLAGVVGVIVGLVALFWPVVTVLVLVVWAGAWAVVTGILEVAAAVRGGSPGGWLVALAGGLSILAGLVILAWPGIGLLALATALAIYALMAGVSYLSAAWQVRRAPAVALLH